MDIKKLLEAVEAAALTLAPVVPQSAIVAIGANLAETLIKVFAREGTVVVDENGNPITAAEVEARVLATWEKGIAAAQEGSAIAQGELERTED